MPIIKIKFSFRPPIHEQEKRHLTHFIPLLFFTATIKRGASDIKKPRQQAGPDATCKKQEINKWGDVGSQGLQQADKKRDSRSCLSFFE